MEVDETVQKATLMTMLHSLFSTTTAVKKLMGWRRSEDEERWAEKAIETLVKKLRKKPGALDELQRAISNPQAPSRCVTIERSMDGRMQISHRKGMPHVIYCKLWRWADLRSHHELRALDCCKYPFNAKHDEVCINPYHYRRLEPPQLPDIHVSKLPDHAPHQQQQPHQQHHHFQTLLDEDSFSKCSMPKNVTLTYPPEAASPGTCDEILSYLHESARSYEPATPPTPSMPPMPPTPPQSYTQSPHYGMPAKSAEAIPYRECPCWATIAYYELNSRVGEPFQCTKAVVSVDGYTSPVHDGDRFCLGKLSNINRNSVIENVRQHIGQGVTLHYAGGDLFADCTSSRAIFVQSRICNHQNNYNPTDVIKVHPGMTLKIFDTRLFSHILNKVVHDGFAAVYNLIKMCTIRMSFVKGWGADYHREDVTATPCWIEITLNGPLKWLDNVLVGMGGPANAISSVS